MNENIIQYITSVNDIYQTGETTEHSFRGSLETLLKSMLPKSKKNQTPINVINEPKRKEYGAPDFELRKGDVIISFIETKDVFDKDLRGQNDKVHKEQFDRYKKAINTIAFTDYLEFVLYEKGEDKHLTGDELLHYQKIVVALDKTIRTQERIDEIIEL